MLHRTVFFYLFFLIKFLFYVKSYIQMPPPNLSHHTHKHPSIHRNKYGQHLSQDGRVTQLRLPGRTNQNELLLFQIHNLKQAQSKQERHTKSNDVFASSGSYRCCSKPVHIFHNQEAEANDKLTSRNQNT